MDAETIVQDLNRRFAAPLPEFYRRRVIVWIDEDGEFKEKVGEMQLAGAKVFALDGANNFAAKKLLAVDDPGSNYLLYRPFPLDRDEDNWLLDVELWGEEFRADLVSMLMNEMGVAPTPAMREAFKRHRKFFNARARRDKLNGAAVNTPAKLELAIMGALAGVKGAGPGDVLKAVLQKGRQNNPVFQEFVAYGVDQSFWRMAAQGTGYQEAAPDLGRLAAHLLATAAAQTLAPAHLAGLSFSQSASHQAFCHNFVADWQRSPDAKALEGIAQEVEAALKLPQRFMKLTVADLVANETFPCVDVVILLKLMADVRDNAIAPDAIFQAVERRRTGAGYADFRHYYEGLRQVAKMQAFCKAHAEGFHTVEPAKIWEAYASDYYLMDAYYREFHKCHAAALLLQSDHPELSDPFFHVNERAEGLYVNWFLTQLGDNWSAACAADLAECGQVRGVPRQEDFYESKVASATSRVYVIVSDAMRYEVAAALAERLRQETQAEVKLQSRQAVFPTITKFGMAALLPHRDLSVEEKNGTLVVLADGQPTEAGDRDKALKAARPASVALRYKDVVAMKRADRQALVKGMDVVYIYHDAIDEAGHQGGGIFAACDTAIEEVKNMVRIITGELGGVNVLVTADHGFLYTDSPLKEDDKVDKTTPSSQDVEVGRRYAIMQKGARPEYLLPVRFLGGSTPYDAFAPRESIRIKVKGGNPNFVHGGISLQEMMVPVIEYHFLRNQSREYKDNPGAYDTKPVAISLLSPNRKICNLGFRLDFFQNEPVGGNREAATYRLWFTDAAGAAISDTQTVIADKSGENPQERVIRCSFHLKSMKFDATAAYWLVVADEDGLQTTREEFHIDIALADDFNFFG